MGVYYFDASALVKLYIPERGSEWVDQIVNAYYGNGFTNTIAIAKVGIVEVAAAFARRYRMGDVSRKQWHNLYGSLMRDALERFETLLADDVLVWEAATLTKSHPLRGYDAVHLATALVLNRKLLRAGLSGLTFVSADKTLCKAAEAEGLRVVNPDEM